MRLSGARERLPLVSRLVQRPGPLVAASGASRAAAAIPIMRRAVQPGPAASSVLIKYHQIVSSNLGFM